MHKSLAAFGVFSLFGGLAIGACSSSSSDDSAAAGADAGEDASQDGSINPTDAGANDAAITVDSGSANPLPFVPANLAVSDLNFAGAGDVELNDVACIINTDELTIRCNGPVISTVVNTKLIGAVDAGTNDIAVFMFNSFKIDTGIAVTVTGSHALALVSKGDFTINGTLTLASNGNVMTGKDAGAGFYSGGSFCGHGGGAGTSTGGVIYGTPSLIPLLAGSAGGISDDLIRTASNGGGALEMVAGGAFVIGTSGGVNAPGAAGMGFAADCSGGGSGGALLLEGSTVEIYGFLTANGGGGGNPDLGVNGQAGQPTAASAGYGGSAGTTINGAVGTLDGEGDGYCAGGAAGWLRVDSTSGAATIGGTAVISPSITTTCFSQGMLK